MPSLAFETLNARTFVVYGYVEISYKDLVFKDTIHYMLFKYTFRQLYSQLGKSLQYSNFVLAKLFKLFNELPKTGSNEAEKLALEIEANNLVQLSIHVDENCVLELNKNLHDIKMKLFSVNGLKTTTMDNILLKLKLINICGAVEFFNNYYSQKNKLHNLFYGYQCTIFENCFKNSLMLTYVKYFEIETGHFIMPKDPLAIIYPFLYQETKKVDVPQPQQQHNTKNSQHKNYKINYNHLLDTHHNTDYSEQFVIQ